MHVNLKLKPFLVSTLFNTVKSLTFVDLQACAVFWASYQSPDPSNDALPPPCVSDAGNSALVS